MFIILIFTVFLIQIFDDIDCVRDERIDDMSKCPGCQFVAMTWG